MASALKLTVVAEGVEDPEEVTLLATLGCDYVQGYVLSEALEQEEIIRLIRQFRWDARKADTVAAGAN